MGQHVLKRRQNHSVFSSEEYLFSRIAVSHFFANSYFSEIGQNSQNSKKFILVKINHLKVVPKEKMYLESCQTLRWSSFS